MNGSPPACRSRPAIARFVLCFALLLTLDLLSKSISFDRLLISETGAPPARVVIESETVRLIPGLLHLRLTANQGAVFGIGQGKRWFFVIVSLAATAFLICLFLRTRAAEWPTHLLLGGLLAGVIGNMYDRIVIGYVRDMLWMLPEWRWEHLLPFLPAAVGKQEVF
ncbi:MAG: signal peptidase II, partial [Phycisphaerae bacterium]|nr:signal peptidase II [Phycisphaerae bacterium]